MRACQLCGCASWGPIGSPEAIARLAEFIVTDGHEFVRCDGCKSIGRKDLLEEVPQPITPPDAGFDVGAFMKPVMATLMPPMPAPPTRTERLVHTILRSGYINPERTVDSVVAVARSIEHTLDEPMTPTLDPHAKQPWLVLSFPAQDEFERWCTGLWDAVNQADKLDFTTTQDYPPAWYEAAVSWVQKK